MFLKYILLKWCPYSTVWSLQFTWLVPHETAAVSVHMCVFSCDLPPALLGRMTQIFYVLLRQHRGGMNIEIRVSIESCPWRSKFSCQDSHLTIWSWGRHWPKRLMGQKMYVWWPPAQMLLCTSTSEIWELFPLEDLTSVIVNFTWQIQS